MLKAGGDAARVVFSGVGKRPTRWPRRCAAGILQFNVESAEELQRARRGRPRSARRGARSRIRVNPDVDARTHRYIATALKTSKFGVPVRRGARKAYQRGGVDAGAEPSASTATSGRRSPR